MGEENGDPSPSPPLSKLKGGINLAEMVRVNTRISTKLNEWLDKQTEETGLPKSTQIMLALEQYYQQKEVMSKMNEMNEIIEKLNEVQKQIEN